MKNSLRALPLLFPLLLTASPTQQQAKPAPEKTSPGLILQFKAGNASDARETRLVALYVPEGSPPAAFVPPGPFSATWDGYISVDLGTDVTFSAVGNGKVSVLAAGKPAFQAEGDFAAAPEAVSLRLRKGRNKLLVHYDSPAKGDAFVRLYWTSSDFQREPIPPAALSHPADLPAFQDRKPLRDGRELVAMRRCVKCHLGNLKGMPELEIDAPSLAEAGARLNPDWMARWILAPRMIRPEATMPKIAGLQAQDAADMAAYLATLGKPDPAPASTEDLVKNGGYLFVEMRCIGCHTLPGKDPAPDRIPFTYLHAKWTPAGLKKFLLGPEKHYAWIEMPNFHLSDEEAGRLAAFLLSRPGKAVEPMAVKGDPARGKQQVETRGCMNCHTIAGTNAFKAAAALKDLKAGACKGPDFGLGPVQVDAVAAFLATDQSALSRESLPEFAERQFLALRCFACHRRDDVLEAWTEVAAEAREFEPPKKADDGEFATVAPAEPWFPSLTWTGEKLKPEWAVAFLKGEIAERPRPFLKNLRMPAFPARAEKLVHGLALEHGYPAKSAPEPEPDHELSEIGRKLSGPAGGLDCLSCHAIGPKGATKVFEAPAPNFRLVRDRMKKDYYDRWVREPLRLEPGTKMPQFIKDGRTQLTEILDGDGVKQADALWQYLLEGAKIRPPGE
jgi:mono/diheme cytochrome c family protein